MRNPPRGAAALLALVVAAGLAGTATVQVAQANNGSHGHGNHGNHGKIKNVIYLLGDGMGRTHVTAARDRYYGAAGKLEMERLPARRARSSTYAVEQEFRTARRVRTSTPSTSPTRRSAATAWASGVKTYNAALGVDGHGQDVVADDHGAAPRRRRLPHRQRLDRGDHRRHAGRPGEPRARCAAARARSYSAADLPEPQPVTGVRSRPRTSGSPRSRTDRPQQHRRRHPGRRSVALRCCGRGGAARPTGTTVLSSPSEPRPWRPRPTWPTRARSRKVFALFNKGNMTVEKYKRENPASAQAQEPSLPEMTTKALALLREGQPAEGLLPPGRGRPHRQAVARQRRGPDARGDQGVRRRGQDRPTTSRSQDGHTLVIVTADHETAGFSIIEKGTYTNAEAASPPANVDAGNTGEQLDAVASRRWRPRTRSAARASINGAGSGDPKNFGPATFRTVGRPARCRGRLAGREPVADLHVRQPHRRRRADLRLRRPTPTSWRAASTTPTCSTSSVRRSASRTEPGADGTSLVRRRGRHGGRGDGRRAGRLRLVGRERRVVARPCDGRADRPARPHARDGGARARRDRRRETGAR